METTKSKKVAILGSTGSIGCQALEVIRSLPGHFDVEVLTAQNNAPLLIRQAMEFVPNAVVIGNESFYALVRDSLADYPVKVFAGKQSLKEVMEFDSVDVVLAAMVGIAGLEPTISAIRGGKTIALANKETLVVAGNIISSLARECQANIFPVDSEHSAIFQCLAGELHNKVEKIYLTASGGPFRGKDKTFLSTVKKEKALIHPNWKMGCKITIDSATLMNKGLEVIEAKWLFGLNAEQIHVVIHPQSIIHSIVQFEDGSMKAQMGLPDMKLPIQYALTYPLRLKSSFARFRFAEFPLLSFEAPDYENFPCLQLAYTALRKAGNMPCILNAANEVAVAAFLKDRIGFNQIPELIETCMQEAGFIDNPGLDDILDTDSTTRILAGEVLKQLAGKQHLA